MKPKIGILFVTSGWFRDVGLQSSASSLSTEVDQIAAEIMGRFAAFMNPVFQGVLYSEAEAAKAAVEIHNANVDGLILSPLMWCEDQIPRAALTRLPKLKTLVCTFFPSQTLPAFVPFQEMLKGSGSVGTLQMSGFLKREGYDYESIAGYYRDELLYQKIEEHCKAFAISRQLKSARCGVLPFPCDQMSTTFVDQFAVRRLYGIELRYLELRRFRDAALQATDEEIDCLKKLLEERGVIVSVDERNLNEGIKYAIALESIVREENLQILAMNDVIPEMHHCFGLRPCLDNPRLSGSGVVVSMEADIAAGIGMYILRLFTRQPPFYTELFTADLEQNALVMGHAGYHDGTNCDEAYGVEIVPDVEYKNSDPFTGACTYFKYKPGPVTLVNCVYSGEKLRIVAHECESLPGPHKLEGNCHLFCRIEVPLAEFYEKVIGLGVSQHWIVVAGRFSNSLERLCKWLDIDFHNLI